MQSPQPRAPATNRLETFLAILGAAACLIITIVIWRSLSSYQSMWPLPALYLVELPAVSIIAAWMLARSGHTAVLVSWAAAGILFAFSIVGAWSVGFLYLPVAFIFGVVSVSSDARTRHPFATHLGVFLLAAVAQAAIMFAVIRLLSSSAAL
jgi:hypothetical protein